MQLFGFFGVVALVGLMWLSGFHIVPENALGRSATSSSASAVLSVNAPLIQAPARTNLEADPVDGQPTAVTDVPVAELFIPASVSVMSARNIEAYSAVLRGEVAAGSDGVGSVFFVYSYDQVDLERSIGSYPNRQAVENNLRVGVSTHEVARSLSSDRMLSVRVSGLAPDSDYYARLCAEYNDGLLCSRTTSFSTIPGAFQAGEVEIPIIRLYDETATDPNEMQIDMQVRMRDTSDGGVYLVFGESENQVRNARSESYSQIDEDRQRLQKVRVARDVRGTVRLQELLEDLDEDTKHYYFVCVEYDGLRDGVVCSSVQTFTTYDEDYGTSPAVTTDTVAAAGNIARLSGSVRMRDFNNGKAFFVYGTDVDRIENIGGETTMQRQRQSIDRLQRVLVDADVDRSDSFAVLVSDLLSDQTYAARLCVEYTNQNENYRDVSFVECGQTQTFTAG